MICVFCTGQLEARRAIALSSGGYAHLLCVQERARSARQTRIQSAWRQAAALGILLMLLPLLNMSLVTLLVALALIIFYAALHRRVWQDVRHTYVR